MNNIQNIENQNYKIENLVLLYNSHYKNDNTADYKLKFWWLELYWMIKTSLKKKLCDCRAKQHKEVRNNIWIKTEDLFKMTCYCHTRLLTKT